MLEKKVQNLLRENEKLRNDNRQNNKNMYQAAQNVGNYQAAIVVNKLLNNLGSNMGLNNRIKIYLVQYQDQVNKAIQLEIIWKIHRDLEDTWE